LVNFSLAEPFSNSFEEGLKAEERVVDAASIEFSINVYTMFESSL
jgi:hypothetical protein